MAAARGDAALAAPAAAADDDGEGRGSDGGREGPPPDPVLRALDTTRRRSTPCRRAPAGRPPTRQRSCWS
ncbi:MAG: hypothetical protein U1F49_07350 [Rubrivivax sp.]